MIDFLYKSSLSLLVLLVFYHLVLEKQKMHQFNRFYLLFGLVFSFVLPFITIEIPSETTVSVQQTYGYLVQAIPVSNQVAATQYNYKLILLWSIYVLIMLLLLFRYIRNILRIITIIKSNTIVSYKSADLVLVNEEIPPHTFLNYIFLNKTAYQNRKIEEELYTHELIHVAQKHTLDVLLIEALKTIFWFNPILIFYKKAIQLNHEFLADEKVVTSFSNVPFYQNLLLTHATVNSTSGLTSNLNYSVTKKRFIMMTKTVSKTKILLSKIMLLPLLCGFTFFMSVESVGQTIASDELYANSQTAENGSASGWKVTADRTESAPTKRPEIMMSAAYNLSGMNINIPAFQNTTSQLANYILSNYKSPAGVNKSDEILSVTFNFEKDGSLDDVKIINGKGTKTEAEILKILKSSPKFSPEKNYGKADWQPIAIKLDFRPISKEDKFVNERVVKEGHPLEETNVLQRVTSKPEYPEGTLEFYKFIGRNFKVPAEAGKIEGKLYLEFMVEKDGSLSEFKVVKDLGFGLGDEAIRVLKLSPKWNPGTQDGKPVRVLYSLPITIQSEETPEKNKVINSSFPKIIFEPTIFGN
ncbi:M56 family metallopeptidase [Flavobacterium sp. 17A]|uniref:M56 family metallopeptidase n=1 Tax=Flavobacterium potami TaxID=2872310 RepID=A0A9X1HC04_9FLAO|nr:M56 family metallopeptidase [Flavobacterium potami]MBZ4036341.1 M56 family metallopeptidase [Flavobacterium potami]